MPELTTAICAPALSPHGRMGGTFKTRSFWQIHTIIGVAVRTFDLCFPGGNVCDIALRIRSAVPE